MQSRRTHERIYFVSSVFCFCRNGGVQKINTSPYSDFSAHKNLGVTPREHSMASTARCFASRSEEIDMTCISSDWRGHVFLRVPVSELFSRTLSMNLMSYSLVTRTRYREHPCWRCTMHFDFLISINRAHGINCNVRLRRGVECPWCSDEPDHTDHHTFPANHCSMETRRFPIQRCHSLTISLKTSLLGEFARWPSWACITYFFPLCAQCAPMITFLSIGFQWWI